MSALKPRPRWTYREEYKNEKGEWVCGRMTYDQEQYEAWKDGYRYQMAKPEGPPSWLREHRFAKAAMVWREDYE